MPVCQCERWDPVQSEGLQDQPVRPRWGRHDPAHIQISCFHFPASQWLRSTRDPAPRYTSPHLFSPSWHISSRFAPLFFFFLTFTTLVSDFFFTFDLHGSDAVVPVDVEMGRADAEEGGGDAADDFLPLELDNMEQEEEHVDRLQVEEISLVRITEQFQPPPLHLLLLLV